MSWEAGQGRPECRGWLHQAIEAALARTTALTGIATSVAEDIDRWGMITLLDYKKTSTVYRGFDALEVRLLAPANWAIGKLTRCLEPDLRDVVEVFRRQAVPALPCVRVWGRALRASPASTAQFQFRRNVERFLTREGQRIWRRSFEPSTAVAAFHRAARISGPPP